jgi:hypothetical protein
MYVDAQRRMADSGAFIWLTHEVYAYGHRDTLIPAIEPNGDDWLIPAFSRA